MPLEAKVFRARNAVRYPNLPDIMRLRARRVIIDDILNRQRKHLSARVAGEGRRLVRGQDNHDGPDDVADGIGRHPAVVVGLVLVIVAGLDQLLLPAAAATGLAGLLVVFGAIRSGALPLLGLFVADSCYGAYFLIFLLICRFGLSWRLLEAPDFYVLHRLLVTLTYNIASLHTPNISSRYPDILSNHGQFAFKRPCIAAS